MIHIETLSGNAVKVTVTGKLKANDFELIAAQVNDLIHAHGTLQLVIDATEFHGWENSAAAAKHFGFVREHQKKIDRIALVASHDWQHWLAGIASVFVHPEIKIFGRNDMLQAENWVTHPKAA